MTKLKNEGFLENSIIFNLIVLRAPWMDSNNFFSSEKFRVWIFTKLFFGYFCGGRTFFWWPRPGQGNPKFPKIIKKSENHQKSMIFNRIFLYAPGMDLADFAFFETFSMRRYDLKKKLLKIIEKCWSKYFFKKKCFEKNL